MCVCVCVFVCSNADTRQRSFCSSKELNQTVDCLIWELKKGIARKRQQGNDAQCPVFLFHTLCYPTTFLPSPPPPHHISISFSYPIFFCTPFLAHSHTLTPLCFSSRLAGWLAGWLAGCLPVCLPACLGACRFPFLFPWLCFFCQVCLSSTLHLPVVSLAAFSGVFLFVSPVQSPCRGRSQQEMLCSWEAVAGWISGNILWLYFFCISFGALLMD